MEIEKIQVAPSQKEAPKKKLSYEEFLAWADEDTLAEWVDGQVFIYSPASLKHQDLLAFLYECLAQHVRENNLGKVILPPFQMKLETRPSGREPDLLFVRREHLGRLKETYLEGPADLVVEIVSPESAARDRGEKFYEYEAAGVEEYWLLDPEREQAEFYQLSGEGFYQGARPDEEGVYHSKAVPCFWLKVDELWQI